MNGAIYLAKRVCDWGKYNGYLTTKRLVLDWSAHPEQPGVNFLDNFTNHIKADKTLERNSQIVARDRSFETLHSVHPLPQRIHCSFLRIKVRIGTEYCIHNTSLPQIIYQSSTPINIDTTKQHTNYEYTQTTPTTNMYGRGNPYGSGRRGRGRSGRDGRQDPPGMMPGYPGMVDDESDFGGSDDMGPPMGGPGMMHPGMGRGGMHPGMMGGRDGMHPGMMEGRGGGINPSMGGLCEDHRNMMDMLAMAAALREMGGGDFSDDEDDYPPMRGPRGFPGRRGRMGGGRRGRGGMSGFEGPHGGGW
ncbi:hypothetical protein SNOG_10760 [Parastagonospora nodorum SN15]|uniref:Uncharacterized protein n=2 Tax=Phaeosphaeria nodorum (strain SN15 / ATCC MYA-4574 / FGSC 10173) TaxID=321614 RepID=Q0UBV4_PHANO|nr:hypothetical protein SNOG_10760 [Parastagonospora nodorum SN15]EAT82154.1 hypothetical protein SNOG_10760 [Parastagonospora nodorum SN15]